MGLEGACDQRWSRESSVGARTCDLGLSHTYTKGKVISPAGSSAINSQRAVLSFNDKDTAPAVIGIICLKSVFPIALCSKCELGRGCLSISSSRCLSNSMLSFCTGTSIMSPNLATLTYNWIIWYTRWHINIICVQLRWNDVGSIFLLFGAKIFCVMLTRRLQ